ncbi:DUF3396 domain-containing protein [Streptomyces sp. SID12501]|uniref:DUF3396 domain-containing protein n=1 Tax=Streptomyces sp. SID12501 TaxID=2706042 RepID=A0A6B3C4Z5_9ACTN|nr:DUF3396 domain-containing protein [Streptomyces sp. SID12501]NEC91901.1 DUF3396 domain-containing protein [Streptomyces sp. SID12501]
MSLLVSVTLDSRAEGGVGKGIASWFEAALAGPLAEFLELERRDSATSLATSQMRESEKFKEFSLSLGEWGSMRQELMRAPEVADVLITLSDSERPAVHVHSSSILVRQPNVEIQLLLGGDNTSRVHDVVFCTSIVNFLVSALNSVNPAFGRVCVGEPMKQKTNLDAVLRKKIWRSVADARHFLRGYAWVTVCPEELTEELGGADSLERTGAFYRVVPLGSGGAVLQATETISGYSDEAMRRTFDVLAPVLPPGLPRFDPANPAVRFVSEDAGQFGQGVR